MREEQRETLRAKREAKEGYQNLNQVAVPKLETIKETRPLRVWWIPQVPGKAFEQEVASVREGALLLHTLAKYDQFQLAYNIKPDYCNAGGLSVKVDGEWEDWSDDEGKSVEDLMDEAEAE